MKQGAPRPILRPRAEQTVEERLTELERLLGHVLERAQAHPYGRKVLAYLGLDLGQATRSYRPPPEFRAQRKGKAPARPTGGAP